MAGFTSVRLPKRGEDWLLMSRTVRLVLGIPAYGFLAVIASAGSLSVFVLSRNIDLFLDVIMFGDFSLTARFSVLIGLYPLVGNAYAVGSSLLLILTALLVGIDIALIAYHLRTNPRTVREGSGGVTGVVLGTLGAGCAACGSAILAGLFSLIGAGSALALLPLDGLEFTLLALVVLVLSIHWIAEGLRGGEIRGCPVDIKNE